MKRKISRIISAILSVAIISTMAFSTVTSAANYPTDHPNTYTNTGDQVADIIGVAKTQIGYVEGSGDLTKYNEWMTNEVGWNHQGVAWCATFIAWCANQAGIPKSIIACTASTTALLNSFPSSQIHYQSSGYRPQPGDIAFFTYTGSTVPNDMAHVGLVEYSSSDGTVKLIEGNCSSKVNYLTRPQFGYTYSQYIVAYATPKYTNTNPQTVGVTGVSVSMQNATMEIGESGSLSATVLPSNATNKNVTWSSSDTSVVTVTSTGTIKAVSAGTAVVTAKTEDGGYTAACNVTVNKKPVTLSSIAVTSKPSKTTYYVGDSFASAGLKITATYSDGSTKDVTSSSALSGFNSSSAGTKTITVSYTESSVTKTATFTVTVNNKPVTLSSIEITTKPAKTSYAVGESFSSAGIKVTANYSDGSKKDVTSSVSYSGFSSSTVGNKTVTVKYTESSVSKTATFTVSVILASTKATLSSLEIVTLPKKLDYKKGETFASSGLKVVAEYSDGTAKDVTSSCTITGADTSSTGSKEVKVTYSYNGKEITKSFNINVKAVKSISVSGIRFVVRSGQDMLGENYSVKAVYSDGSTEVVTSDAQVVVSTKFLFLTIGYISYVEGGNEFKSPFISFKIPSFTFKDGADNI